MPTAPLPPSRRSTNCLLLQSPPHFAAKLPVIILDRYEDLQPSFPPLTRQATYRRAALARGVPAVSFSLHLSVCKFTTELWIYHYFHISSLEWWAPRSEEQRSLQEDLTQISTCWEETLSKSIHLCLKCHFTINVIFGSVNIGQVWTKLLSQQRHNRSQQILHEWHLAVKARKQRLTESVSTSGSVW